MNQALFPLWLNKGSEDIDLTEGLPGAVTCLQKLLYLLGFGEGLVVTGVYDEPTAERVKALQRTVFELAKDGSQDDEHVDGHFGENTRQELLVYMVVAGFKDVDGVNFDVNLIPFVPGVDGRTHWKGPGDQEGIWPE